MQIIGKYGLEKTELGLQAETLLLEPMLHFHQLRVDCITLQ